MTQEGQTFRGDGLGKKGYLEQLGKPAARRFVSMHKQQRRVKGQKDRKGWGYMVNVSGGWTSEEEAALEWAVSEGCRHGPGPAVSNLHKTQHELGLQLNKPVPQIDEFDPAAHFTNNTRRILSRLGVGRGCDDHTAGTTPRHPHGGGGEGTAYSMWHRHQQERDEWEKEPKDTGLSENEVDAESIAEDEEPCGSYRCGDGGVRFQEELARACRIAVREDKRLKRKMAGIVPLVLKESRKEQRLAVSNWKKVARLLHRCLTRTLSENAELVARKGRLQADLLRTELELEETSALVSSLLAGQGSAVNASKNIDGSTAAADGNDLHPCHASVGRETSADDASSTDSSTDHQGVKLAAGVLANGGAFNHSQGSPDRPWVKPYSPDGATTATTATTGITGDALVGSPVVLSPVTEVPEESFGSGESEISGGALRDEDVARLTTFKALVTNHEASRALQERDRADRAASGRLAHSTAAASAPEVDRSAPSSKSPNMVGAAPGDTDSSGSDDDLSLRCSGSASGGASCGSSPGSPPVAAPPAPAAPGMYMSYCLPGTATKPPPGLQRSADTRSSRSSSTPGRKGLPPGHQPRHAAVAPAARSTNAVGGETKPAAGVLAVGMYARIRRQPVPAAFAVGDPPSSTGTHSEDLLMRHPLATRRTARAFAAAAAFPAKGFFSHQAHSERQKPAACPKATDTLKELDRTRRAIRQDMSDRLSAVTAGHSAAVAAVTQPSASTAACKARDRTRQAAYCGTDIMNTRPLIGRQAAKRPPSSLQINAGYRVMDFFDRFSPSHGGSIEVDAQGSAASTMVLAERGRKIRVGTSSGVGRVASPSIDAGAAPPLPKARGRHQGGRGRERSSRLPGESVVPKRAFTGLKETQRPVGSRVGGRGQRSIALWASPLPGMELAALPKHTP